MTYSTDTKQIIAKMTEGSIGDFEKIYKIYSGKLYNFMMQVSNGDTYISEEAVQVTFIRLWEVKEKVDPSRQIMPLLCTIAKNFMLNNYQRNIIDFACKEYILNNNINATNDTENDTDEMFLQQYINKIALQLPPMRQKVFLLSKIDGLSNKDIANELNISESAVSTHLALALKFIREKLSNNYIKILLIYWINHIISLYI